MTLTDAQIKAYRPLDKAYKSPKERGLFLLVNPNGSRLWRHAYTFAGKESTVGLGAYPEVTLKEARERRDENRRLLSKGLDPAEHKRILKAQALGDEANLFGTLAAEWLQTFAPDWSADHKDKIESRLNRYVLPWLAKRPIDQLTAAELLVVIKRIAVSTLDTAHRALQNVTAIFRYAATARDWPGRPLHNIALDLSGSIPPNRQTKHFAAIIEPKAIGALMLDISRYTGKLVTRCALKLEAYTFVRPGELRHAEWTEFSLDAATWSIAGEKMKMDNPHIVPLSRQAMDVVREVQALTGRGRYVFPGDHDRSVAMSENAVVYALRRMGYNGDEMTGHGFRAMARTALDEVLGFRPDIIEHQQAHKVKDPNGRAYNRTTFMDERRRMMQVWADYLDKLAAEAEAEAEAKAAGLRGG